MTEAPRPDRDRERPESDRSDGHPLNELFALRERLREQARQWSQEAKERLSELEQRLGQIEDRLEQGGERASQSVKSKARELLGPFRQLLHEQQIKALSLPVSALMTKNVLTCTPNDGLHRAAQLMWENNCGVIPVCDESGVAVAALTDRDVSMAAYTQAKSLSELRVSSAMSRTVFSCAPDAPVLEALSLLRQHQVRRLFALWPDGKIAGIISLADITHFIKEKANNDATREALLDTLSAISAPEPARN